MSGRAWEDQVELFGSASAIVACHGAGLANLVFCPVGAKVVEISAWERHKDLFGKLCEVCELKYNRMEVSRISRREPGPRSDIVLDIRALDKTLDGFLK